MVRRNGAKLLPSKEELAVITALTVASRLTGDAPRNYFQFGSMVVRVHNVHSWQ
jgi:hypothetical protein